jgi:hypothetical protein
MRSLSRSTGVLALASLGVLAMPTVSSAQDGAAKVLEDATEFADRQKRIKIKLPRLWKAARDEKGAGLVASFEGSFTPGEKERIDSKFWIFLRRDSSRAGLVRFKREVEGGTRKEGSFESGEGWQQVAVKRKKGPIVDWFRAVEKDGAVFLVQAAAASGNYDTHGPIVEKMLASFEVTGAVGEREPPKDWTDKKSGDFVVWTDADWKESKGTIEEALRPSTCSTTTPRSWASTSPRWGSSTRPRARSASSSSP